MPLANKQFGLNFIMAHDICTYVFVYSYMYIYTFIRSFVDIHTCTCIFCFKMFDLKFCWKVCVYNLQLFIPNYKVIGIHITLCTIVNALSPDIGYNFEKNMSGDFIGLRISRMCLFVFLCYVFLPKGVFHSLRLRSRLDKI